MRGNKQGENKGRKGKERERKGKEKGG